MASRQHLGTKMAATMPKMITKSQSDRQHPLKSTLRTLKTALQIPKMAPKLPRIDGRNIQDSSKMVSKMVPKMSLDGQSNPHDGLATNRQAKLEGAAVIPEGIVNKINNESKTADQLSATTNVLVACASGINVHSA